MTTEAEREAVAIARRLGLLPPVERGRGRPTDAEYDRDLSALAGAFPQARERWLSGESDNTIARIDALVYGSGGSTPEADPFPYAGLGPSG